MKRPSSPSAVPSSAKRLRAPASTAAASSSTSSSVATSASASTSTAADSTSCPVPASTLSSITRPVTSSPSVITASARAVVSTSGTSTATSSLSAIIAASSFAAAPSLISTIAPSSGPVASSSSIVVPSNSTTAGTTSIVHVTDLIADQSVSKTERSVYRGALIPLFSRTKTRFIPSSQANSNFLRQTTADVPPIAVPSELRKRGPVVWTTADALIVLAGRLSGSLPPHHLPITLDRHGDDIKLRLNVTPMELAFEDDGITRHIRRALGQTATARSVTVVHAGRTAFMCVGDAGYRDGQQVIVASPGSATAAIELKARLAGHETIIIIRPWALPSEEDKDCYGFTTDVGSAPPSHQYTAALQNLGDALHRLWATDAASFPSASVQGLPPTFGTSLAQTVGAVRDRLQRREHALRPAALPTSAQLEASTTTNARRRLVDDTSSLESPANAVSEVLALVRDSRLPPWSRAELLATTKWLAKQWVRAPGGIFASDSVFGAVPTEALKTGARYSHALHTEIHPDGIPLWVAACLMVLGRNEGFLSLVRAAVAEDWPALPIQGIIKNAFGPMSQAEVPGVYLLTPDRITAYFGTARKMLERLLDYTTGRVPLPSVKFEEAIKIRHEGWEGHGILDTADLPPRLRQHAETTFIIIAHTCQDTHLNTRIVDMATSGLELGRTTPEQPSRPPHVPRPSRILVRAHAPGGTPPQGAAFSFPARMERPRPPHSIAPLELDYGGSAPSEMGEQLQDEAELLDDNSDLSDDDT